MEPWHQHTCTWLSSACLALKVYHGSVLHGFKLLSSAQTICLMVKMKVCICSPKNLWNLMGFTVIWTSWTVSGGEVLRNCILSRVLASLIKRSAHSL